MGWIKRAGGLAAIGVAVLGISLPSVAADHAFGFNGRLKQGISLALDHEGGSDQGPTNYVAEVGLTYAYGRTLTINGDFWLRGDLFSEDSGSIFDRGIQDFNSNEFRDQFGFFLNSDTNSFTGTRPFGHDSVQTRVLDDVNDIIRQLAITYRASNRSFQIKLGKFQRGWGQSDGLRLIDILNPQDFRTRFAFSDSSEIRIPQTGLALDLNFERLGIGKPFRWLGLKKTGLELIYYPQVLHSQFVVNNPTPTDQTSGGIWGFPFPVLFDPVSNRGLPFIGANLHDVEHDEWDKDKGEFGVRFKFSALSAEWTFNGFWGYQDLPVVKLRGGNLIVGSVYNDVENAALVVPLDVDTSVFATWGPGGYMQQLRGTQGPVNADALLGLVGGFSDLVPGGQQAPFACTNIPLAQGCSVTFDLELDYDYRQRVIAMSVTREMQEIVVGRKQVSPVLRVEASYEFDKPFNNFTTQNNVGTLGEGSAALIARPEDAISTSDQVGIMAGFDFPLYIPFWDSQPGSIFTSFQYFNFYTPQHENKVYQAPYMGARLERHQEYATALWFNEFFTGRLYLEGLLAIDFSKDGVVYRQRADFNFFGDRIRPRLEWIGIDATREEGAFGFIHDSDTLEFSLTYQF